MSQLWYCLLTRLDASWKVSSLPHCKPISKTLTIHHSYDYMQLTVSYIGLNINLYRALSCWLFLRLYMNSWFFKTYIKLEDDCEIKHWEGRLKNLVKPSFERFLTGFEARYRRVKQPYNITSQTKHCLLLEKIKFKVCIICATLRL